MMIWNGQDSCDEADDDNNTNEEEDDDVIDDAAAAGDDANEVRIMTSLIILVWTNLHLADSKSTEPVDASSQDCPPHCVPLSGVH